MYGSKTTAVQSLGFGGRWSKLEDDKLKAAVDEAEDLDWLAISKAIFSNSRSAMQCQCRWEKVLRQGLVKGPWTSEEDEIVMERVTSFESAPGAKIRWSSIAEALPGRLGKQARERWYNHLDPALKKTNWTAEEDDQLKDLQARLGNRWSEIAKLMPGRSENNVKNRWNSHLRKKLKEQVELGVKMEAAERERIASSRKRKVPEAVVVKAKVARNGRNKTPTRRAAMRRGVYSLNSELDDSELDCASVSLEDEVLSGPYQAGEPVEAPLAVEAAHGLQLLMSCMSMEESCLEAATDSTEEEQVDAEGKRNTSAECKDSAIDVLRTSPSPTSLFSSSSSSASNTEYSRDLPLSETTSSLDCFPSTIDTLATAPEHVQYHIDSLMKHFKCDSLELPMILARFGSSSQAISAAPKDSSSGSEDEAVA